MMATLPTVPGPFTDGTAPTIVQLNQLSYAVSFIANNNVRPTWHFYKTTSNSLTQNAWNSPSYGTVAFDSDSVHSGGAVQVNTQGYYEVEACFDISVDATAFHALGSFLWTAGSSNPHFTSGTTLQFGGRGGSGVNDGSSNTAICITDICPNVCYPGDTIQPQVYVTDTGLTLKVNTNDSWNEGRFVCNFTGRWICEGT